MRILVIIVSYNFERWIDRCLGSLRESVHPVDTVVIDNCSSDSTIQLIEQRYPEVRLIKNKENLGFGRANNIGMEIAITQSGCMDRPTNHWYTCRPLPGISGLWYPLSGTSDR